MMIFTSALFVLPIFSVFADESSEEEVATFAGGCFWCMQQVFDSEKGVLSTTVGYTGGDAPNPTYAQVSSGQTGHAEAIEVRYDPNKISYEELLQTFWRNVDPEAKDAQFCDKGPQYRSEIFTHSEEQKELAEKSKQALLSSGQVKVIYTEITPVSTFYPAEEYHQKYYLKKPTRYKFYKYLCGRAQRLKELWEQPKK